MKITKIKVAGYKNLNNCEIKLDNFNVLIGANNSGKSNFLELFNFLDYIINGSDEMRKLIFERNFAPSLGYFKTYKSKDEITSIEIEYMHEIGNDTYKYWYDLVIKNAILDKNQNTAGYIERESFKYKNIKSTGVPKTVFERTDNEFVKIIVGQKQLQIDKTVSAFSIISKLTDVKNELEPTALFGLKILQSITKTHIVYSSPYDIKSNIFDDSQIIEYGRLLALNLNEEIAKILKSENRDIFKNVLKDILGIEDIVLYEGKTNPENIIVHIYAEYPNGIIQSLYQLSDGTVVVLNLIVYLFSTDRSIIAIEEIENSLHPKLLQKLILLMKNNFSDKQIIITTHSPVLLNMIHVNEVSIFISKECGNSEIIRVKDKKDLVRKLSQPMSSFGDIFFMVEDY